MSDEVVEEAGEGGLPIGALAMVAAIVFLVAISGMFAIGFIPPLVKHPVTTTTTRGTAQFITITTAGPPVTTTLTSPGGGPASTTTVTAPGGAATTVTSTVVSTNTVAIGGATTTSTSTVTLPAVTTTATSTTTSTSTVTATTTPTSPLNITVAIAGQPSEVYFAGDTILFVITVTNRVPSTTLSLYAYQKTPQGSAPIMTFFPQVPENFQPPIGVSVYRVESTVFQNATVGQYEVDVQASAISLQNGATLTSMDQQFVMRISEPLSFTGATVQTIAGQLNGTCGQQSYLPYTHTTWVWKCLVNAAPMVNGTITFTVTNYSNEPVCIQTSIGSLTGYVKMNPYPFCAGGGPGVLVPVGATSWPFTYYVMNGPAAGAQVVYFMFTR